jgi:hypothetical protein
MVLQVRSLAAFGAYDWLYAGHQLRPGCSVARANVTPPQVTGSTWPLLNKRFSSGADKVLSVT